MELKTNHKLAIGISREQIRNLLLPLSDQDIYCFEKSENIFSYSVVMILQKDYHLVSHINELIREVAASGLIFKWAEDSGRVIKNDNILSDAEAMSINIILKLEHVQGAFLLTIIGYVLSLIAFISEWLCYWYQKNFNAPLKSFEEVQESENKYFPFLK